MRLIAFQSTLPVWGATAAGLTTAELAEFQSTLPVWGATSRPARVLYSPGDFNPRSPCGERLRRLHLRQLYRPISIHAPRVGSDVLHYQMQGVVQVISIHAPRVGSDCSSGLDELGRKAFQSTLPVWGATQGHGGGVAGEPI